MHAVSCGLALHPLAEQSVTLLDIHCGAVAVLLLL